MSDEANSIDRPTTVSQLLGAFHEFFVVSTHLILYLRRVYPESAFQHVRRYGIQTYQCRHPKVITWIENMAATAMTSIRDGSVRKISVVIVASDSTPLERFAFDVSRFPTGASENDEAIDAGITYDTMTDEYRACISTLVAQAGTFGPLPADSTFTVLMETRDKPHLEFDSPWLVADRAKYHSRTPASLTARHLRFVNAGPIAFSVVLEQDKSKLKLPDI